MIRFAAKYSYLLCLGLFSFIFCHAQQADINEIRTLLYKAHHSKVSALALCKKMKTITPAHPLLFGYKGMADIMMCYHTQNPYTRMQYFRSGKAALDKAISERRDDVELRYLRFTAQSNTPAILMYKDHITEDKKMLLTYLLTEANKTADKDLYKRISDYLVGCEQCSPEEKNKIRSLRSVSGRI